MNIYDLAHDLARGIKDSPEFQEYKKYNGLVMANEENKKMVEDFREKIMKFQIENYGKEEPNPEELERIQQLQNVLMMNSEISQFLQAELKFSQMYEDINKILLESINLD
ncbi:MAG: YlbF family regulator [Tissierellia bacterium]|nr:YlbF family regulator [Tissierellia bacterium]